MPINLKKYLKELKHLRYNWKNEIPPVDVNGSSMPNNYKVRKNWFQAVLFNIEYGIQHKALNKEIKSEYKKYENYLKRTYFHYRDTKLSEIKRADEILDKSIKNIEDSLKRID